MYESSGIYTELKCHVQNKHAISSKLEQIKPHTPTPALTISLPLPHSSPYV
jgi:hypothetical protein